MKKGTQIKINGKTAVITDSQSDRGIAYYKAFVAPPRPFMIFGEPVVGQYIDRVVEFQEFRGKFRNTASTTKPSMSK